MPSKRRSSKTNGAGQDILGPPIHTLRGHNDVILRLSWSPAGDVLASTSVDRSIRLWDWERETARILSGHREGVNEVAWDPAGRWLASCSFDRRILIWDLETGQNIQELRRHLDDVTSISLAPAGDRLASGSADKTIAIWDTRSWQALMNLARHTASVHRVAWSPRGNQLASCSKDGCVIVWDPDHGFPVTEWRTRSPVASVAWSPSGRHLCATRYDGTVHVWSNLVGLSGKPIDLAHHTNIARSASFSHDERLLGTSSMDGTVRLWRTDTWEPIGQIAEPTSDFWPQGIAFHPSRPLLATFGERDRVIRIWRVPVEELLGLPVGETHIYRNAKVVLLGDTGVGKSALRLVLTGEPYAPTDSTYGRRVWTFGLTEHETARGRETRETLLWDMAGQPGYRLIHQLHLNEVAVALLVFDARQAIGEPLSAVRHWERALRQAQQRQGSHGIPLKRFLVLARADIQGSPVSTERIDTVVREWALDGFFRTSAKEDTGIDDLGRAIRDAIAWDALPEVKSPDLFTRVRHFLLAERTAGRLVAQVDDLYRAFSAGERAPAPPDMRQVFETCISPLENRDLIRRLSFGTLVLLQPELLD